MTSVSHAVLELLNEIEGFEEESKRDLLVYFFHYVDLRPNSKEPQGMAAIREFYTKVISRKPNEIEDFARIVAAECRDLRSPSTTRLLAQIKVCVREQKLKGTDLALLVGFYICKKFDTPTFTSADVSHIANSMKLNLSNPTGTIGQMASAKHFPLIKETEMDSKEFTITQFGEEALEGLLGLQNIQTT